MKTDGVRLVTEDCKHCTNIEGESVKGQKRATLPSGDIIYQCSKCGAMWGVDKDGKRLDG